MVEQLTLNQLVTGSSPAPATTLKTRGNAGLFAFGEAVMRDSRRRKGFQGKHETTRKNGIERKIFGVKFGVRERRVLFRELPL